jgi:hypothetical protein
MSEEITSLLSFQFSLPLEFHETNAFQGFSFNVKMHFIHKLKQVAWDSEHHLICDCKYSLHSGHYKPIKR